MIEYDFVLDSTVFYLIAQLRPRERLFLVRSFESLASNPYVEPDDFQTSPTRTYSLKRFGHFTVMYWVDHGASEVRIIEVLES